MCKRILFELSTLAVVASALPVHAETRPSGAPDRNVVVVDAVDFITTGLPKTVHDRDQFFAGLRKQLGDNGWTATLPSSAVPCATGSVCLFTLADDADAPYALRITGEGNLVRGYTLHLQLYSVVTRRSHYAIAYCDLCLTERMATIASDFVLRLIDDATKEEEPPQAQERVVSIDGASFKEQPAPEKNLLAAPVAATGAPSHLVPVVSWLMIGVGVLGLAYGGWALAKNGDTAGDTRLTATHELARDRYATTSLGTTSLAFGGVLTLVGALLLLTEPGRTDRTHLAAATPGASPRY